MITFVAGLCILIFGYIFYSKYIESQFEPTSTPTPAHSLNDGMDFVPLGEKRNGLIQLLNIAGIGPILGAVQGILFGPVAFLLIPVGCILMGGVHDYFSGMISVRDSGMQLTGLIKKYLGNKCFHLFIAIVSVMLLLVAAVFVYTSGDLFAERFLHQTDFSLSNPVMITIYAVIIFYYIAATLFPVDKIIGKFYPIFGLMLVFGTLIAFVGYLYHGIDLQNVDFRHINLHPKHLAIIPIFFMTVSCGLLSGFHSTQSTIVSRTLNSEYEGRRVFYGMMCLESLIAMIWAAGAMHVYAHNLVPDIFIGKVNTINVIANNFVPYIFTFFVTAAIIILPITSGDTAMRSLRLLIAEALNFKQNSISNCLIITIPIMVLLVIVLSIAKIDNEAFFLTWRYFTFANQLIASIVLCVATVFLYKNSKNYFVTLLPALFCLFVSYTFILNAKIGFSLSFRLAEIIAAIMTIISCVLLVKQMKKYKAENLSTEHMNEKIEKEENNVGINL